MTEHSGQTSQIVRITVDVGDTFGAFLDAQEIVVPKDEFCYLEPSYNVWNEDFRWHRGLWRALMDATAPLGIWRYTVLLSDLADGTWLELGIRDPRAAEVITPEFAAEVFRRADWVNILHRIRHGPVKARKE